MRPSGSRLVMLLGRRRDFMFFQVRDYVRSDVGSRFLEISVLTFEKLTVSELP